jgi:hypothetical protein
MSTVTVVPTVEVNNLPPRVRLDVTDTGSSPAITSTTVMRLDADGNMVPVRTLDGNPLTLTTSGSTRVGLVYDYEMPYGTAVSYSTLESPTVTSAQVTVAEGDVWLVHPGVPSLSQQVLVGEFSERATAVTRGVFYPMGRATAVVVTDGARKAAQYDLTLVTLTDDAREAMAALLSDAGALLLNVPATKGFGVNAEYVAIGDAKESRVSRIASEPARRWSLQCTVIDRPAGGSQSQRTFVDLLDYPTLAALQAKYSSFTALLAGP